MLLFYIFLKHYFPRLTVCKCSSGPFLLNCSSSRVLSSSLTYSFHPFHVPSLSVSTHSILSPYITPIKAFTKDDPQPSTPATSKLRQGLLNHLTRRINWHRSTAFGQKKSRPWNTVKHAAYNRPRKLTHATTVLICILEVLGSNFSRNAPYPERCFVIFHSPFKQMPVWYLDLYHNCFIFDISHSLSSNNFTL
jgi:hypothetical protein